MKKVLISGFGDWAASMCLETQVEGLRAAIAAVSQNEKDIDEPIRSKWQT